MEEARAARRAAAPATRGTAAAGRTDVGGPVASAARSHVVTEPERKLRDVTESWRGTPYKLGGTSRNGIDCSAFSSVLYDSVYKVDLPRTAQEQERLGKPVDRRSLEAGDLIFFRTQGMGPLFRSRHVGVYLGGGEFAQASGRRGVTISSLDNRYWSGRYHSARRPQKAS
jgi:probable lipoprotein NlpC